MPEKSWFDTYSKQRAKNVIGIYLIINFVLLAVIIWKMARGEYPLFAIILVVTGLVLSILARYYLNMLIKGEKGCQRFDLISFNAETLSSSGNNSIEFITSSMHSSDGVSVSNKCSCFN